MATLNLNTKINKTPRPLLDTHKNVDWPVCQYYLGKKIYVGDSKNQKKSNLCFFQLQPQVQAGTTHRQTEPLFTDPHLP